MTTVALASMGDGNPIEVLVVDDDPEFLFIARQELLAQGFVVRCAGGGLQAVFTAGQDAPDAVLCDLRMPGLNGLSVADALRQQKETRTSTIVACTADRTFHERAPIYGLFDAVIEKPVDWSALGFLLRQRVEARRAERAMASAS
jgi:two-component system OmpR family response regulator